MCYPSLPSIPLPRLPQPPGGENHGRGGRPAVRPPHPTPLPLPRREKEMILRKNPLSGVSCTPPLPPRLPAALCGSARSGRCPGRGRPQGRGCPLGAAGPGRAGAAGRGRGRAAPPPLSPLRSLCCECSDSGESGERERAEDIRDRGCRKMREKININSPAASNRANFAQKFPPWTRLPVG